MKTRVERIYQGKIVDLVVEHRIASDGRQRAREIIRHPGGVAVLAEVNGEILFVRQLRYPLGIRLLELPAGKLDRKRERPDRAAARELEEETGYRAARLRRIGAFFLTPGFCDEVIHLYLAEGLRKTRQRLDGDEEITVETYRLETAMEMLAAGEIRDAKTTIGLQWLALRRADERKAGGSRGRPSSTPRKRARTGWKR